MAEVLALHDLLLSATQYELFALTLDVAQGAVPLKQAALFLEERARPLPSAPAATHPALN